MRPYECRRCRSENSFPHPWCGTVGCRCDECLPPSWHTFVDIERRWPGKVIGPLVESSPPGAMWLDGTNCELIIRTAHPELRELLHVSLEHAYYSAAMAAPGGAILHYSFLPTTYGDDDDQGDDDQGEDVSRERQFAVMRINGLAPPPG